LNLSQFVPFDLFPFRLIPVELAIPYDNNEGALGTTNAVSVDTKLEDIHISCFQVEVLDPTHPPSQFRIGVDAAKIL
jgi:hypothetical protein